MGSRIDKMLAAQGQARRRAAQDTVRVRPKRPFAAHLLGIAGLCLILLDVPLVWNARSHDWNVSDGVLAVMVFLFIGSIGLVGLAALVRGSAGKT